MILLVWVGSESGWEETKARWDDQIGTGLAVVVGADSAGSCRPSWPPDAHATIIRLIIACSRKNRDQLNATRPCPFRRQNISRFFASTTA